FWPPNHRMHTVNLAFNKGEFDGDTLTIEVLSITNNDTGREHGKMLADNPDGTGIGNTGTGVDQSPDSPLASTTAQVRAERLGSDRGGRVYAITVKCSDSSHPSDPPRSGVATLHESVLHKHLQLFAVPT